MPLLKEFPALSWTTLAGIVTGALAAWQSASATGTVNWWLFLLGFLPVLAGALTHAKVIPVETVRDVITFARSTGAAVSELAEKAGVAVGDRPTDRPPAR